VITRRANHVLAVGFGNPLAADDGAGAAVVERLRQASLPPWVPVEHPGRDSRLLPSLRRLSSPWWNCKGAALRAPRGQMEGAEPQAMP